ncbi:purine nucleoside phosphorylase DeoD-type [Marinitoga sp. 1154]|uniref:purine-nucleoside phosphorylase n=1 Tax=Marinitoga sp. 1154 TaxID=1643335 RepID=UPI0006412574|nr:MULTISPECIES: purine-nucleoside phosphorylase [unclassified Marinitoga]NUU98978.1 purine nucleoside phosphorylase DeoD-type [Marinitoga sp. 1154]
MIPTPHIEVDKKGIIAETVIMPGDPLRAKFIAETFLENPVLFNTVRNMFGYTGTYKGKKISVMGSGMGMPSIGIYSYELFKFYDVQNIIRVGSCGAYTDEIDLYDVILVEEAYSESTFAKVMGGIDDEILKPSNELNKKLENAANSLNIKIHKGRIHSSDVFYRVNFEDYKKIRDTYGCIAVEMESFALFANAMVTGKNAACLLTVSDSLVTKKATSSEERMKSFTNMMKIALEMA